MIEACQRATGRPSWASSLGAGPGQVSIDPNGNLATKTEGTDNWVYSWNAENQLIRVEKNGAEQARFAYDPLGRRVEKAAGSLTTSYAYDVVDILRETRGSSQYKYVHGPGVDTPLAREDGTGTLSCYHVDGLGSITQRTGQSGEILHEYRYDVWGNIQLGAAESGYAFTGREWDPEIGAYFYRARYFDPRLGRFLSGDPSGTAAGINLYEYVGGRVAGMVDPFGDEATSIAIAGGFIGGGAGLAGVATMAVPPAAAVAGGAAVIAYVYADAVNDIRENPPPLPPLPPIPPANPSSEWAPTIPPTVPPTTATTQAPGPPPFCPPKQKPQGGCSVVLEVCNKWADRSPTFMQRAWRRAVCLAAYVACLMDPN